MSISSKKSIQKNKTVTIRVLDSTLEFETESKMKVIDLLKYVIKYLKINYYHFYGLFYAIGSNKMSYLNLNEEINFKEKSAEMKIYLRLSFFPIHSNTQFVETNAKVLLFLTTYAQLTLMSGYYALPEEYIFYAATQLLLSTYISKNDNIKELITAHIKQFIPEQLKNGYKLSTNEWISLICQVFTKISQFHWWKLIKFCIQKMENSIQFGYRYVVIRTKDSNQLVMGINSYGISLFANQNTLIPILRFSLNEIDHIELTNSRIRIHFDEKNNLYFSISNNDTVKEFALLEMLNQLVEWRNYLEHPNKELILNMFLSYRQKVIEKQSMNNVNTIRKFLLSYLHSCRNRSKLVNDFEQFESDSNLIFSQIERLLEESRLLFSDVNTSVNTTTVSSNIQIRLIPSTKTNKSSLNTDNLLIQHLNLQEISMISDLFQEIKDEHIILMKFLKSSVVDIQNCSFKFDKFEKNRIVNQSWFTNDKNKCENILASLHQKLRVLRNSTKSQYDILENFKDNNADNESIITAESETRSLQERVLEAKKLLKL